MSNVWQECGLGDVVMLKRGYDLPRRKRKQGLVPVVSSSGITGYHDVAKVKAPGVVTGRTGTLGEVFYMRQDFWPLNTSLYVQDFNGNDPRFVYYLLRTLDLGAQSVAAAVPGVNRNFLHMLPVKIPHVPTQRKIAAVLSALDDLIENNTRRIQILEEMAQAIYREWFVNYRFPGHENASMTCPDYLPPSADNANGSSETAIPQDWEFVRYSELLSSYLGGGWGPEEPTGRETQAVLVIRGTDFLDIRAGLEPRSPTRHVTQESFKRRQLRQGDIVVENSVNASSRCVGSSLLITNGVLRRVGNESIAASFCKVFRPKDPKVAALIHGHLKHLHANGTMEFYQNVATNGIGNFQARRFIQSEAIPLPRDGTVLSRLALALSSIYDVASTYAEQNYCLRRSRDLLLPKLVSGEVDVSELNIDTSRLDA